MPSPDASSWDGHGAEEEENMHLQRLASYYYAMLMPSFFDCRKKAMLLDLLGLPQSDYIILAACGVSDSPESRTNNSHRVHFM